MRIAAIINLKGGVGKTITSINLAYSLAADHGKRVLLIDNDKQGNTSKFFGLHSYETKSIADLLTERGIDIHDVIQHTEYDNLDLISSNMTLHTANMKIAQDMNRPQQTILKGYLYKIAEEYDYCVIDNAPDVSINVTNALVAANDVIVPIKIDKFAFDGMEQLAETFAEIREYFNPGLHFLGCVVTMYAKNNLNKDGAAWLENSKGYPLFKAAISRTVKIDESTFTGKPIVKHFKNCRAARDYTEFTREYLEKCVHVGHK